MILDNSQLYNIDSNFWFIFHSRGIIIDNFPEITIGDNFSNLIYSNIESDYDDIEFFNLVYYCISIVEKNYGYKLNYCNRIMKKNGSRRKYNYDIEVSFKI